MGKIEKQFKKGRYSNMFRAYVGVQGDKLLNQQEFYEEWDQAF